jgi:hypothetical protein
MHYTHPTGEVNHNFERVEKVRAGDVAMRADGPHSACAMAPVVRLASKTRLSTLSRLLVLPLTGNALIMGARS